MTRTIRLAIVPAAALVAACGAGAGSPTAPVSMAAFTVGAGAYSLRIAGGASCIGTTIHGAPAAPTEITLNVTLSAAGTGAWNVTLPGHSLSGRVTTDGSSAAIALKGSAKAGTVKLLTDPSELALGGSARNGERYDGVITAGRAIFESLGGVGAASATCSEGTFTLRRAS